MSYKTRVWTGINHIELARRINRFTTEYDATVSTMAVSGLGEVVDGFPVYTYHVVFEMADAPTEPVDPAGFGEGALGEGSYGDGG